MEPISTFIFQAKVLVVSLLTATLPTITAVQTLPSQIPQNPVVTTAAVNSNFSANWAGYAATGGNFTSVSGTWVVPNVQTGRINSADATWVGIGGIDSQDLIQSGTQAVVGRNGQVSYDAWIETLPQYSRPISVSVNPGDSVTISITETSPNQWQISFRDNTTSQSFQTTRTYESSHSSAEWIEEAPSGLRGFLPLDNFGLVNITNATTTKDGQQMSAAQAGARAINMGNANGQILASTSTLGPDGASFTVNRSNATQTLPSTNPNLRPYWISSGQRGSGSSRVTRVIITPRRVTRFYRRYF